MLLYKNHVDNISLLNDDQLTMILPLMENYYPDIFKAEFPKLVENDKKLLRYIWMSTKRVYQTSGAGTSFQLSESQFLPGIDKDEVKTRLENINQDNLDEDEKKILNLYLKAYTDGFQERKLYDLDDLHRIIEL